MRDPFTSKLYGGEHIGVRDRSCFENILAGSEVPPEIRVCDWPRCSCENQDHEEDDEQAAIKAEQGGLRQWEMLERSICDDNAQMVAHRTNRNHPLPRSYRFISDHR